MEGLVMIMLGVMFYSIITMSRFMFLKKVGLKPTFMNCFLPFYKAEHRGIIAIRLYQQMAMMFIIVGAVDIVLEKTGVFADGLPLVLQLKIVGPVLLILASILLRTANKKSDESFEQQDIEN